MGQGGGTQSGYSLLTPARRSKTRRRTAQATHTATERSLCTPRAAHATRPERGHSTHTPPATDHCPVPTADEADSAHGPLSTPPHRLPLRPTDPTPGRRTAARAAEGAPQEGRCQTVAAPPKAGPPRGALAPPTLLHSRKCLSSALAATGQSGPCKPAAAREHVSARQGRASMALVQHRVRRGHVAPGVGEDKERDGARPHTPPPEWR